MDKVIEFSIPIDDEGFVSLQCPFCHEAFKVTAGDFESEDIYQLYCPYCGLVAEDGFHTDDMQEHALNLVENERNSMMNQFGKELESMFSGNDLISFKAEKNLPIKQPKTLIEPTDMYEVDLKCCDKKIKLQYRVNGAYCPFCGVK
jgi:hypothetical protein